MGHGKLGKSGNLKISFPRPAKSLNLIVGHERLWNMM